MAISTVCALLAAVCGVVGTVPYVVDTVRRTTVPHRGSWLIWSVLGVVAVESQRADGARWSLLPLSVQALGTCVVLLLSIRLGSGGLSGPEIGLLALAGAGVVGWQTVGEPVIATGCVILADLIGALLMIPKAWRDPDSETCSLFVLASLGGAATAGAVGVVAAPLLIYPGYFCLVNGFLALMIGVRRGMFRSILGGGAMMVAAVEDPAKTFAAGAHRR